MGAIELTAPLMLSGEKTLSESHHIPLMNLAYVLASFPLDPKGLTLLTSFSKMPFRKQSVRGVVLDKHCRQLFMKQVFPRFLNPTTPLQLSLVIFMSTGLFNSSISAKSQFLRWNRLSFYLHCSVQQATFSHWQMNFSQVRSQQPSHFFSVSDCRNHFFPLSFTSTRKKSPSSIYRFQILLAGSSFFPKPLIRYSQVALSTAILRQLNRVSRLSFLSILQSLTSQLISSNSFTSRMFFRISSTVDSSDSSIFSRAKSDLFFCFWSIYFNQRLVMERNQQVFRQTGTLFSLPSFTACLFRTFPEGKSEISLKTLSVRIQKSVPYLSPGRRTPMESRRSSLRDMGLCLVPQWERQKSLQLSRNFVDTKKQVSSSEQLKSSWSALCQASNCLSTSLCFYESYAERVTVGLLVRTASYEFIQCLRLMRYLTKIQVLHRQRLEG